MAFAKKRFGQNFLIDQNVINRIIATLGNIEQDHIVEIGPGRAALTEYLLHAKHLDIIEIDNDLIVNLDKLIKSYSNVKLHHNDALQFDFNSLITDNQPLRIVGNLPYNISTPLLFHLLEYRNTISDMTFMLQKEVVNRICAQPGNKAYGKLSIMLQYFCQVENLFTVPATAFKPAPKIESAIIRLTPHKTISDVAKDFQHFQVIVTQAFSQRRKTLRNCLKTVISENKLKKLNIDPQQRPEQLTIADYILISNNSE